MFHRTVEPAANGELDQCRVAFPIVVTLNDLLVVTVGVLPARSAVPASRRASSLNGKGSRVAQRAGDRGVTDRALAREVRHDKTRLIRLLDGLERRGLIERDPDPADRRSRTVAITDLGRNLHAGARAAIRKMEDDVLDVLTAVERQALLTALPKLYAAR